MEVSVFEFKEFRAVMDRHLVVQNADMVSMTAPLDVDMCDCAVTTNTYKVHQWSTVKKDAITGQTKRETGNFVICDPIIDELITNNTDMIQYLRDEIDNLRERIAMMTLDNEEMDDLLCSIRCNFWRSLRNFFRVRKGKAPVV